MMTAVSPTDPCTTVEVVSMQTTLTATTNNYDHVPIAASLLHSDLLLLPASSSDSQSSSSPSRSLRVCCYGSSSSQTPEKYLQEARHVGYLLAKRGHVCVNGAGSFGCMAAMNDGVCKGNGHVVGVIHQMWLVDGKDADDSNKNTWTNGVPVRDGGAHGAFAHSSKNNGTNGGAIREMLVAGGNDLQERKRLLMEGADALLVLPGGPGTWDELWEAACARGIGLTNIPIVVVNTDGYYDPFLRMMERAYEEGLTKLEPDQLIHFENSAEGAIRWIESIQGRHDPHVHLQPRESRTVIRKSSMMMIPPLGLSDSWFFGALRRSLSRMNGSTDLSPVAEDEHDGQVVNEFDSATQSSGTLVFALGIITGAIGWSLLTNARGRPA